MKAKFGAIVVAGSGKVGGHVFSKNRGGAYMRTKVTPANPNTVAQQNVRAILSSLSQSWSGLTEAQRLAWQGAVTDWSGTDIFGDIKNPSGVNLYVRLNSVLLNAGKAVIANPPLKTEMPYTEIVSAVFDVSSSTLVITFADANYDGVDLAISATPVLSNGVNFVKSQFRRIATVVGATGTADAGSAYLAKFGTPVIGGNVRLQVQPVLATGQIGTPQSIKVLVQA